MGIHIFPIGYSLFPIGYSLLAIPFCLLLFPIPGWHQDETSMMQDAEADWDLIPSRVTQILPESCPHDW